jgi:hypothetical protein
MRLETRPGWRSCLICDRLVPFGAGIYYTQLRRVAHKAACADVVELLGHDFSCSSRGRKRNRSEWMTTIARCRALRVDEFLTQMN